jgi:O6-methylguanine-DNA--protein-cysteine methyltransferase
MSIAAGMSRSPVAFGRRSDEGFDEVARQLKEYLAGGRREFDLPLQARGSGRSVAYGIW